MRSSVTVSLRRALAVALLSLGVLSLAPGSAAADNPVARPSCTGPSSLGCVTCPAPAATCSDPTGYAKANTQVTFDGSSSTASPPATKIVNWRWTYSSPGSSGGQGGSSPTAKFGFSAGPVLVKLEVTDDLGAKGSNTINIVIGARLFATPSPSIVLGGTLSNSARVIGRVGATSQATIDFRLYGPNDALCTGTPAYEKLGVRYPLGDGGTVSSGAFAPTQIGEYRWTVTYGNDANNVPAPSICAGTTLVTAPPPPPPAPPPGPVFVSPGTSTSTEAVDTPITCAGRTPTITAVAGKRTITGTAGADVIVGGPGDDKIDGRGGNDLICGGGGDDEIRGSTGNDRLYGNNGDDLVLGGDGNDYVHGGNGADRMAGQNGTDHVDGAAGNDLLDDQKLGGKGRDELIGGSGGDHIRAADRTIDTVECGSGRDTARIDVHDGQRGCEQVRRIA
jgi:Ca2+-binding RTX toxin-like protein